MRRVEYLKSYRRLRETQFSSIQKTQQILQQKRESFTASQKEQSLAMQNQTKEINNLEGDKKEVNQTLNTLKSKEGEIAGQLAKKTKQRKAVSNAITAAIERERKEAARLAKIEADRIKKLKADADALAKKNATASGTATKPPTNTPIKPLGDDPSKGLTSTKRTNRDYSVFEETDKGLETSLNFEKNKGSLPRPVTGPVVTKFGTSAITDKMSEKCEGIEIGAPVGTTVKCVADGVVTAVMENGDSWIITVQHGKYWSAYSFLSTTSVTKGQQVRANTVIGKTGTNDVGEPIMLFMITNAKGIPYNPESWLRRN